MYYFGTYQECKAYDEQVTAGENYVHNDNWANPIEINGVWYILAHEDYPSDLLTVADLPQQEQVVG